MTKYGNRKVIDLCYGTFDSKAEHDRWMELVALETKDHIRDLRRQKPYVLSDYPRCVYTPDADYLERDGLGNLDRVVEDVKGSAARDVFVRVCWLLHSYPDVACVRLLRKAGPRTRVPRGWRLVAGWLVREYRREPAKKRRSKAA